MKKYYYVGCDLHKRTTWFHVTDARGKKIISKSISNSEDELHKFFTTLPGPFILAVEATYNWYFFVDIAEQYTQEVYMADSYALKAFAKRHKKTDKIDARLIADILRKGYLPTVTIVDKRTRRLRELLRYRVNLVKDHSRNVTRMKAILDKLGENSCGDMRTKKALDALETEHLHVDYDNIIKGYIQRIRDINKEVSFVDKQIRIKAQIDRDTILLMKIPGIKYFSSLIIKTEICDIDRFKKFGQLCAYAGLAPRVHKSGKTCIHGALMKNRRKLLRWILLEVVIHFVKEDEKRREKFERIKKRKGFNAAKVVLARDMLKIIYKVLKEKRPYYSNKNTKENIRAMAAPALATV